MLVVFLSPVLWRLSWHQAPRSCMLVRCSQAKYIEHFSQPLFILISPSPSTLWVPSPSKQASCMELSKMVKAGKASTVSLFLNSRWPDLFSIALSLCDSRGTLKLSSLDFPRKGLGTKSSVPTNSRVHPSSSQTGSLEDPSLGLRWPEKTSLPLINPQHLASSPVSEFSSFSGLV